MKILLVEPGKKPVLSEIDGTLQSMQNIVGGTIQAIYPFAEPVALICNDEGKLLGLPLNRALRDEEGRIYDVIAGAFFLCGAPEGNDRFESLTNEQQLNFYEYFKKAELFLKLDGKLCCIYLN